MYTRQSPIPDTSISNESTGLGHAGNLVTAVGWTVQDKNPALHNTENHVISMGWHAPATIPKMVHNDRFKQQKCLHEHPDYDRSLQPAGSCDIMLGRSLGTGCQLKYSDDRTCHDLST